MSWSTESIYFLCHTACSHSWISSKLANRLQFKGTQIKLTVNGVNTQENKTNRWKYVSLFDPFPNVQENLRVGSDIIDNTDSRSPSLECINEQPLEVILIAFLTYCDIEKSIKLVWQTTLQPKKDFLVPKRIFARWFNLVTVHCWCQCQKLSLEILQVFCWLLVYHHFWISSQRERRKIKNFSKIAKNLQTI